MASVTYDHVVKRYTADVTVVKDFNVEIKDKEFMVLVGPSGCGKSPALRMLAGLEAISEGKILIGDRVVNNVAAKDRDIAMVFQSYALYPHMSVYDNMAFPLQMQRMKKPEIDKRVRNASRILGLDNFLSRKPRALSGGQRQRVALGRAIVRSPKVFLFDEPLSNLDAALRATTRNELIKQQHELGTTTIYVTHDQVEAMTMGDRICIMNGGETVQIGSPLAVYRKPADTFVARFLGSPPMNLVAARLERSDGGFALHAGGIAISVTTIPPQRLAPYAGRPVTLGIRPEDLYERAPPDVAARSVPLPARINAAEPLGAETLLVIAL